MTTTELSTSIPMANARPPMEMILSEILDKNISKNAATTEIGMASPTIMVGLISLKKTNRTPTASSPPISKLTKTELIASLINAP